MSSGSSGASGARRMFLGHPEIDREEFSRIRKELDERLRPPAKAVPRPSAQLHGKEQATRAFGLAVEALIERGWSLHAIARYMQCSTPHVFEMRAGTRRVSDWVPWKLPPIGRAVYLRELAATIDESELDAAPPSSTGTGG